MPVLFITFGLSLALGVIRLLLRGIAFLLMHFFAGSDAPALDGSFWTIVGVFAASLLATGVLGVADERLEERSRR